MAYRGAIPEPRPAGPALAGTLRLVGIHGVAQILYRVALVTIVLGARSEVNAVSAAIERGAPAPTSTPFSELARDPGLLREVPLVCALFVIVAATLLLLRGRRALGALSLLLATLAVGNFMYAPASPFVQPTRGTEVALALAQLPILWASSQPGQRTFAWLTTAFSVGLAFAFGEDFVRGHTVYASLMSGRSSEILMFAVGPLLNLLPFVCGAIAGLRPLRDDLRGPPPEPALGRAIDASLVLTWPTAIVLSAGGLFAGTGEPARSSWGNALDLGGIEYLTPMLHGVVIVGAVATAIAARHLRSPFGGVVIVLAFVSLGFGSGFWTNVRYGQAPIFDPRLHFDLSYFAWSLSSAAIIAIAGWLACSTGARAPIPRLALPALLTGVALLASSLVGWMIGPPAFLLVAILGILALFALALVGRELRPAMTALAEEARHSAAAATSGS